MKPAPLHRALQLLLVLLVALMPFHAFLTIWAGHLFGHQSLWRAWKEVATLLLTGGTGMLLIANKGATKGKTQAVVWLGLAFAFWAVLISVLHRVIGQTSWWYGVKTDLEFVILFIVGYFLADRALGLRLAKILIVTTSILVIFILLQAFVWPNDFLTHFGYSQANIAPVQHIANSTNRRIFGTLGGPNQLGAYLILPVSYLLALILRRRRWWHVLLFTGSLVALALTYSRSAWLGTLAAVIVILAAGQIQPNRQRLLTTLTVGLVASALVILGFAHFRSYILHGQTTGLLSSSDKDRLTAVSSGLSTLAKHPLGLGLGTAGPASFHGAHQLVTENFYLQIGVETGLVGLLIFAVWQLIIGLQLWARRHHSDQALPLVATLIGVSVVNFFLHGWADSTLAIVFWILAGVTIGSANESRPSSRLAK